MDTIEEIIQRLNMVESNTSLSEDEKKQKILSCEFQYRVRSSIDRFNYNDREIVDSRK